MKILLATDGSPCGAAAVWEVCSRPWPPGTAVTVLSIGCIPFPLAEGEIRHANRAFEAARREAERAADVAREQAPELSVEAKSLDDVPKLAIVEEAERSAADLVVVGTHGYGPVKRFLLGSVSSAVAIHAPCSVLIVRCPRAPRVKNVPLKVLLATDGSPCSEAALKEVCGRPWPPGSEIRVVTAVRTFDVPDPHWTQALPRLRAEQEQADAPALLEKAVRPIRDRHNELAVTTAVLKGQPQYAITDEAERWGADLVMVGSHGYGPVKRALLGSVAHAVALYAGCSVEIVRRKPAHQ